MATIQLPADFKEFLRLLNVHGVEYLLIGGYAVSYYGYVRATADIDLWIRLSPDNARKLTGAIREFGFTQAREELFLEPGKVIRMGVPPLRVEIQTSISGVEFSACWQNRIVVELDGMAVPVISLMDLKANKKASGRHKDLADLEQLG